jgi:hypothetical protein
VEVLLKVITTVLQILRSVERRGFYSLCIKSRWFPKHCKYFGAWDIIEDDNRSIANTAKRGVRSVNSNFSTN